MLPHVERIRADGAVGRALERIYTLLTALREAPLLDGVLISEVALVSGSYTRVAHRLGRRPRGYLVVSQSAAVTVFENRAVRSERDLQLQSSASVTVDLWVF